MTYEATSTTVEIWGRLQVLCDHVDLTKWRGVPTIVEGWSSEEPFSDKTLSLLFPGVTSFEDYVDLPVQDFQNVNINLLDEDNNFVKTLWEGFVGAGTDDLGPSDNGLSIECVGALYQIDFFTKVPNFGFQPQDSGFAVAAEVNLRSKYYGLRLKQMNWLTYSSNPTRNQGSWNQMLTGWVQELLSNSYTPAFMFDDETAHAVATSEDGYWIMGDHGTFATFGQYMPNHGSSTWWNAIFIHLFNDPGLYCTDVWYDKGRKEGYYLSRGGYVGRRLDFKSDVPGFDPWYGEPPINSNQYWNAIHGTTNMGGYRIMNIYGQVRCFGDATHYGDGTPLGSRTFDNGTVFPDIFLDMVPTPSGNGYWLLSWGGQVQSFGDAASFGDFNIENDVFVALEVNAAGTGLYALDTSGKVHTQGTATHYGDSAGTGTTSVAWRDMSMSDGGAGYILLKADGFTSFHGDQPDLGDARFTTEPDAGGNVSQYTMTKLTGRRPVIRTKDTWTVDWTVSVGTHGVEHSITRDRTVQPNVFFGEGTDSKNCKWRNSKYPNFYPGQEDNPPLWPTYYIGRGMNDTSPGVITWQRRMEQIGFSIQADGLYDEYDANLCRFLQGAAGITVDGIIGPQTWTATFNPGSYSGDLASAYIAPLVTDRRVEPFLYSADGSISGNNSNYDKSIMRIETYNNYGEKSSKREATISAQNELKRNADPGYMGSMTLGIDPEEGSRFDMQAGENILYKGYRGEDVLFHISAVNVNFSGQTVDLTIDSKSRDAATVGAMLDRDRSIGDPPLKATRKYSSAKQAQDENVVFDCESKAGFIPYFATPGNLWNVIRIPVGEIGTVVKTEFTTVLPATPFSIVVYDRPITANYLASLNGGDPEAADWWNDYPEDDGLIIGWGSDGQMCGYHPWSESDAGAVLSGKMVDASSWNFWSSEPPWIWIGIWATQTTAISGRLYPGPNAGFNFASDDAIANPMEISQASRPTPAYYGDYP